jgi:eukaryotic-like serine/threonine-protein kinase
MPADPNRVRDLFLAAVELPPDRRPSYLADFCQGDADLRAEVDRLLVANSDPDSILEPASPTPAGATGAFVHGDPGTVDLAGGTSATQAFDPDAPRPPAIATEVHRPDPATETSAQPDPDATTARELASPAPRVANAPTGEGIGTVVAGRYTLVELIGEGGMGSVYLASQTDPVKRQVALKLIKTGMDSRGVLARFDAERQAVALMDHPNIARIYDGGLTPTGQPYFVMELVKGVPLTEYCDQKRLTVKARLELFVAICQAVQHAHQKGIIHRDLKPGNVLVTEVDGRPTPKVIDFGVAKATEVNLTDLSFADTGAIVGTPTYMSPEQAEPSSMDIDTRTDVYALGVMLYELLTGSPPIDASQFKRGALLEMLRMVREVDPPRPSTKLSTAEALPNIAANRSIEPSRLSKLLQGELEWVVMKALEKDRDRRYETANGFARDVQRYLADEVVEARPPSRRYRLKKFVKRNKIQVIAASLVFFALVAGISGTAFGMIRAEQRRREAERNLAFAKKGNEILGSVFAGLDPRKNYADLSELTKALTDNLKKAVRELDGSAIGDPLEVATMQNTLGLSLVLLGESGLALEVLQKARDAQIARLGPDHPGTLTTLNNLAIAYYTVGKFPEAIALFERVRDARITKLGPDHSDTLGTLNSLGLAYYAVGKFPEAIALFERVRDAQIAKLAPDHPDTLALIGNLAGAYMAVGKLPEAIALFERVRDAAIAKLGPDHPDTLAMLNSLGLAYYAVGKLPEAIALFERVRDAQIAKLGPDHPSTLTTTNNLALAYQDFGKLPEAIALFERVRDAQIAKLSPDHPSTLNTLNNLGSAYWRTKQLDKSVPLFEDVLKRKVAKLGRQHPETQMTLANLGVNYKDSGRLKEAIPLLEEAYQAAKRFPTLRFVGPQLLDTYTKAGETAKLADLLQEQLAEARKTLPKDSPQLAGLLAQIGSSLLQQKKWTEAEPLLRECLAIREKTQPDAWSTFNTKSVLGGALLGQKKYAEAEPLLLAGYEGLKQREKTIPSQAGTRLPDALDRLIELSTATNKPDDVKKWQAERAKYPDAAPPPEEKK